MSKTGGQLQSEIRKYLVSKGCDVLVLNPAPGVPAGWPDITFFKEGFWGTLEVKESSREPYRPLQKERIEKHSQWSWSRRVDPSTWPSIKNELEGML